MTRGRWAAFALVLILLLSSVHLASADTIVFASRTAFDAAFPGASIENWDSYPSDTVFPNGSTTAGITYTASEGTAITTFQFLQTTFPNTLGRTPFHFFQTTDTMTFGFGSALMAFGIDINTFTTIPGVYTASTDTGETFASFYDPFPGDTTGQFLGFSTTSPFTSVTIGAMPAALSYSLDTLRFVTAADASAIPEPASLLLLGTGLAGSWALRPKRRLR